MYSFHICGGLNGVSPISLGYLTTWTLVSGCLGKIKKNGLPGGTMSLGPGFEVPKCLSHFKLQLSAFLFVDKDVKSQLLLQCRACLPAAFLPAMMVVNTYPSGTTS